MKTHKGSVLISTIMIMTIILISLSLVVSSTTLKREFESLNSLGLQRDLDKRSIQVLVLNYTQYIVDEQWNNMSEACYGRVGSVLTSTEEDIIKDMTSRFYNSTYYKKGVFDTREWASTLHLSGLKVELCKVKKIEYIDSSGQSKYLMSFLYSGSGKREESEFNFYSMVNVECPDIQLEEDKHVSKQIDWDSLIKNAGVNLIKKE